MPTYQELERIAVDVSREAANRIRAAAGTGTAVATKSSRTDAVTATDIETEEYIESVLREATPSSSMVGEEGGVRPGTSDLQWIVDPIDGTVNFMYDLPVISVSIAATIGGVTVAGAVADVHRGEVFGACKDGGARLNGSSIRPSTATELELSLIGTGFSYSATKRAHEAAAVARILPQIRDIRCMGSAALNLAWVSCGRLDGYFESEVQIWDIAAGALLVDEAGGEVKVELDENSRGPVLAAAPDVFEGLRDIVRQ
ncbi:MAG: inositol monophosphatase family protein [Acidimicrobiia bacterium]